MSRVEEWIQVLSTEGSSLAGADPVDGVLFSMLVHIAFADGIVQDGEFELLLRLMPGAEVGAVLSRVVEVAQTPMDFSALMSAVPRGPDRERLVSLANQMVWGDDHLHPGETDFLGDLFAAIAAG